MKRVVEGDPFDVTAAIVTATAIRLVTAQQFEVGASLAVDLPDEHGQPKRQLFRVSLVRPRAGHRDWIVEGPFVKQLTPPEVNAAQVRLTAVRGTAGWKTSCHLIHVRQEGPWLTTMRNVSRTGIGLISERPIDPGTFLEVELPSIRRKHLKPRLIRVTHAQRQKDGADWELGGVFLRALTEEELQVLL